ncbi:copper resistance protein B [Methylorubrum extorquens]|uniref:Copper resistance protein CopB n=1 Tax=Methylorubrum extorquens (strain ATCC 14718 / DSM 1338 / JCM 2805 / NCIMB 9133 / AM1) TaxID=272630 RepID=C5B1R2_METEA|nr:copper resistance protein B [Methylorubrum extorquens]ACS39696.1 Copper resistance protein CopB precursor [Methylorubrum extorquens AM1]MCP1542186.1 copper resistance protein B [Methylorubrum extorquens]MCP1590469.1 copper resistance protein B [Methylorubrum extorquens]
MYSVTRPFIAALALVAPLALHSAAAQEAPTPRAPYFSTLQPSAGLRPSGGAQPSEEAEFPDQQIYYNVRFDKLELKPRGGRIGYEWDMEAWVGDDYNKLFFKSEGFNNGGAARRGENGKINRWENAEFQVLYSRMISYFWDLQVGVRHSAWPKPSRTYAVFGVEGFAPGFFEVDAQAFLSNKGEVSGRINAFYDLLITNRLILQPRFDINAYAQDIPELSVGAGFSEMELSARLRYEFSREFAPYIGVSWERKLGGTAAIAKREDEPVSRVFFLAGLRLQW